MNNRIAGAWASPVEGPATPLPVPGTSTEAAHGFHLMAKPVGAACNLDCSYCFYLEKEAFYRDGHSQRMNGEALETYVRQYIAMQPTPVVEFTWQGGEPTLAGLDFFRRAVALQRQYAAGKEIRNTLQTNGTLLDDDWAEFLAREEFLVGVSLDGPREIHDADRYDKHGRSSFNAVMNGIGALNRARVRWNALVTVSRTVARHPTAVYEFLKQTDASHLQFNPVVERLPGAADRGRGLHFASPPGPSRACSATHEAVPVSIQTVAPDAYGRFLIEIYDSWVRHDVGRIHVMNFEWALAAWCQLPATVCLFSARCGKAAIVEHDGSMYSCDHFMYPEYRLGNVLEESPAALLCSPRQIEFGASKETSLPGVCRRCTFLFACHGECPKNRFAVTPEGESGLNYLCPSYMAFFRHITPTMNAMAQLVARGLPAAFVMDAFKGPLVVTAKR